MRITAKRIRSGARRREIASGELVNVRRSDGITLMCRIKEKSGDTDFMHVVISAEEVVKFPALTSLWHELDRAAQS